MAVSVLTAVLCIVFTSAGKFNSVSAFDKDVFGILTAYEWANPANHSLSVDQDYHVQYQQSTCNAVHVSALLRHGSRYPNSHEIHRFTQVGHKVRSIVTGAKASFVHHWTNRFPTSKQLLLSDLGKSEHHGIGQRYGERLMSLFKGHMADVELVSSSKERARDSALAFFGGLDEAVEGSHVTHATGPRTDDAVTRFHSACTKFSTTVHHDHSLSHEYAVFKYGHAMTDVVHKVAHKLGIKSSAITASDVEYMSKMCAYELEFFGNSGWCDLFDNSDFHVIAYLHDLGKYQSWAYGNKLIGDMSCPLVRDMFKAMDKVIQERKAGHSFSPGSFWFGHAETLSPLYGAFGLFKDASPPLASGYASRQNNNFVSSHILSFASNIFLVLYECPAAAGHDSTYVTKWFVNEREVTIPDCHKTVCPYDQVRQGYRQYIDACNFAQTCAVGGPLVG